MRLLAIPMRYFPNGWRNEVGKPHLTDALARKTVCGKPVGEDWDVRPLAEGSAHASDWWEFVDSTLCRGCSVVWPTDKETA